MMKKSMDDPIKHRWRNKEYKFIKKHTSTLREPKDWVIAFLPGGDAGLVPTELEIFERLGAKRSNIVGIERDRNTCRRLNSRKLGINLEFNDTENFFKTTDTKFDIISLDYSGQFSHSARNTLKYIAGKQLLNQTAILTTNFYGRMEGQNAAAHYYAGIIGPHFNEMLCLPETENGGKQMVPKINPFIINDKFLEEIGYKNRDFEKIRKIGITSLIIELLSKGKDLLEINPVFLRNPHFKELESGLLRVCEDLIKEAKTKSTTFYLEIEDLERADRSSIHKTHLGQALHFINLFDYLKEKGYPGGMAILPVFEYAHPYFVEDLESYWYRSEKGSPMFSDFFYLNQFRELFNKYKEFSDEIYRDLEDGPFTRKNFLGGNKYNLKPEDLKKIFFQYKEDGPKIIRLSTKIKEESLPQRVFLGSSSERPRLDGRTYYKLRMENVESGQDINELWEKLKENYKTGNGQLKAFERHFNMGTYGPTNIEKPAEREMPQRTYALTEMFNSSHPYGFLERLPKETKTRLGYFLGEDLPLKIRVSAAEKDELLKNIAGSKWYKVAEKEGATGQQIMTLFDDIMLYCVWNEKVPDKDKINELLYNSLKGGHILPERLPKPYVPEVKKGGENMSPTGRPYISKDAVLALLNVGHEPQEIARNYRGFTPGQLRAFKAHLTMNTYDQELTDDLAYELFGTCGLTTGEVGMAFPKVSRHKIGAYKAWDTMRKREK